MIFTTLEVIKDHLSPLQYFEPHAICFEVEREPLYESDMKAF